MSRFVIDSVVKIGWPRFFSIKGITEEPQDSRMIGRKTSSPKRQTDSPKRLVSLGERLDGPM